MERQKQLIQPFVYCAVVFITLGIAIANQILARFGLENNLVYVFSIAFRRHRATRPMPAATDGFYLFPSQCRKSLNKRFVCNFP